MPLPVEVLIAQQHLARHQRALDNLLATKKGIIASIVKARARVEASREILAEMARQTDYHGSEIHQRQHAQTADENAAINP